MMRPVVALLREMRDMASGRAFWLRAAIVGILYAACMLVLFQTEYGPFATSLSLVTLAFICCLGIAVFAPARHRRGAVADRVRRADRAVAPEIRRHAADADVPRPAADRSGYVLVPGHDASVAEMADRNRRCRCAAAAVAGVPSRSVPHSQAHRARRRRRRAARHDRPVGVEPRTAVGAVPGRQSHFQSGALGRRRGLAPGGARLDGGGAEVAGQRGLRRAVRIPAT